MTKDTTTDREALLRAATLVRPAIADKAYIPALGYIMLDGEWATAFDNRLAIAVRCDASITRLVPGLLLVQALSAFGGQDVLFHQNDDNSFVMKSGRSKVTLTTLPLSAFPLKWPKHENDDIKFSREMFTALERCLISISADATRPAQMGVTLDTEDGRAVFFSTDNVTISRAECEDKIKLPGDAPVILPKPFCEQAIGLAKAFPEESPVLTLGDGWLELQYGVEARLFSRMAVDLDPLDFPKVLKRYCGDLDTLHKRLATVPDELDAAMQRAVLVMSGEVRKRTTAKVSDGTLRLHAESDMGNADDTMQIDLDDVGPVVLDAALIARGLKYASRMTVTDGAAILVGGEECEFIHMVGHIKRV